MVFYGSSNVITARTSNNISHKIEQTTSIKSKTPRGVPFNFCSSNSFRQTLQICGEKKLWDHNSFQKLGREARTYLEENTSRFEGDLNLLVRCVLPVQDISTSFAVTWNSSQFRIADSRRILIEYGRRSILASVSAGKLNK